MGVIKTVKDFFSKKHDKSFNTAEFFKAADLTAEGLTVVLDTLQNPVFAKDFIAAINARPRPNGARTYLTGAAYEQYIKHLPGQWKRLEERTPLSSLIAITGTMINDLRDIMAHYKEFFEEESIEDRNIRMTNLIISGYAEGCERFCKWMQWMFIARDYFNRTGGKVNPDDHNSPAKYIAKSIENSLPTVFQVENEILYRRKGTTFMTILTALRSSNKDVTVSSDGVDITTYAEDSSYSKVELEYTTLGIINPFMYFARREANILRLQYERNRELREWIAMRISLLEQEQNGMDPNSPEYAKVEQIMKKYLDQISQLDAKIKQYEVQY